MRRNLMAASVAVLALFPFTAHCRGRRCSPEGGDFRAASEGHGDAVDLGRMLFFDPRLTIDANASCSTCHQPARYGTDGLAKAMGVKQRPHSRNAPTILNAGLNFSIHWRGDRESLEDQVIKALTSPITSGQPDEKAVIDRLEQIPGYAPLFKAALPAIRAQ
jgi:cytochrome c peroxidase